MLDVHLDSPLATVDGPGFLLASGPSAISGIWRRGRFRCRGCHRALSDFGRAASSQPGPALVGAYLRGWPAAVRALWRIPPAGGEQGEEMCCAGCRAPLAFSGAVLSASHWWDAGRGNERALYVNHVAEGAVVTASVAARGLAQGPMWVAAAACARCGLAVGWKFVACRQAANLPPGPGADNVHHEGRYGLVRSALVCPSDPWAKDGGVGWPSDGARAAAGYGSDGDWSDGDGSGADGIHGDGSESDGSDGDLSEDGGG